jgi:hypothetical protein
MVDVVEECFDITFDESGYPLSASDLSESSVAASVGSEPMRAFREGGL